MIESSRNVISEGPPVPTTNLLRQLLGERIISTNSHVTWPARSPDFTTPDYFLWGCLKECVYVNKPHTLEQLKDNIRAEIRPLTSHTFTIVMNNAIERGRLWEAANENHLKDVTMTVWHVSDIGFN